MKGAIACEVLHLFFLKVYIFEDILISEFFIPEIHRKYNQFTKWCFTLWFFNVIKAMDKRKK